MPKMHDTGAAYPPSRVSEISIVSGPIPCVPFASRARVRFAKFAKKEMKGN
jgi:hypothetical protein